MLPPELIELIVRHGWDCLSTTNFRHAYAVTQWMLVSRDWLRIVLPIVLQDLWITSTSHMYYMCRIATTRESDICELAGIFNPHRYVEENCRSLTMPVYQGLAEEYAAQCAELEEYANTPDCSLLIKDFPPLRQRLPTFPILPRFVASFVRDYIPNITALHFILVDCTPVYHHWEMSTVMRWVRTDQYPKTLTDLGITFAYTTPPPTLLRDAPRGTFFPPRSPGDIPPLHNFAGIKRLIVRDVHADFIAYITTACPVLECIESTAEFCAVDLPPEISDERREGFVFRRLTPTTSWDLPVLTPAPPPTADPLGA